MQFRQRTTTYELIDYHAEAIQLKGFMEDHWLQDELYYIEQEFKKTSSD